MAANHQWGYEPGLNGPDKWREHFKTGPNQSPINILVGELAADDSTCCQGARLLASSLERTNLTPTAATKTTTATTKPSNLLARRHHLDSTGGELDEADQQGRSPSNSDCSTDDSSGACELGGGGGLRQQNTRFCVSNKKIFLGYPRYLETIELSNTGHGWQVSLPPELASHTLLSGPPLGDREYRLAQLHCHWGSDCDHGSEHQLNGKSFAAELHFVHWNCTQFRSPEEASRHKHGLAVLAVFVQALEGDQNRNRHLDKICSHLKKVQRPGQRTTLHQARLDLKKLFPSNRWLYASYEGSLTTPPLSEVVDWVVFLKPIQASEAQVAQMRQLRCSGSSGEAPLEHNCRPVQPLNKRLVSIWSHHH